MKKIIYKIYKHYRLIDLKESLEHFEDAVAHRGDELGERQIIDSIKKEIQKLENPVWWLS